MEYLISMTLRAAITPQCIQMSNLVRLRKKKSLQNFWRHSNNTIIQFTALKQMGKSHQRSSWSTMPTYLLILIVMHTSNWWWAMHGDFNQRTIQQACHLLALKRRLRILTLERLTEMIITETCLALIRKRLLIRRGILNGKHLTMDHINIKAVEQICLVQVVET